MTIGIVGVLGILATAFVRIAQIEQDVSAGFVDRVRARMLAEAGLESAMGRLRGLESAKAWSDLRDGWVYGDMLTTLESPTGPRTYKTPPKPLDDSKLPSWGDATKIKPDNRGYTDALSGTYETAGDVFAVKVLDAASMINVNNFDRAAEFGRPAHPGNQNLVRMLNTLGALVGAGNVGTDVMNAVIQRRQQGGTGEFSNKLELVAAVFAGDMTRFNKVRDFITCNSWIDPTTVSFSKSGTARWDRKPRAPINANTAPKEVIVAALTGLAANYIFHDHPNALMTPMSVGPLSQTKAEQAADFLITERNNFSGVTYDNVAQAAASYTYNDWMHFRFQVLDKTPGFSKAEADLVHANANPNTDLRELNPDLIQVDPGPDTGRTVMTGIDKTDLATGSGWTGSTEFCWSSMGFYEVESIGRVYREGRVIAEEKIATVVKLYDVFRVTTQRDFETNRVFSHPSFGSLISNDSYPAVVSVPEYCYKTGGGYRWAAGGANPVSDPYCAGFDGGLVLSGMLRASVGINSGKKSFFAGFARRSIEADQTTYGATGEPTYSSERTKVQNSVIAADHGMGSGEGVSWGICHWDTVLPMNSYGSGNRGSDLHSFGMYVNSQTRNRCRSYYGDEFPVPDGTIEMMVKPEVDVSWWGRSKSDVVNYVGWQPGPIQWDGRMHLMDWGAVGDSGFSPLPAYNELRMFTTKGRIFAHWRLDDGNDYVLWQDAAWARNTWHHVEASWVGGAAPAPDGSGGGSANFMFFVDGNQSSPAFMDLPKDIRRNGMNGNVAPNNVRYGINDPWFVVGGRMYNWPDQTSMGCVDFLGTIDNVQLHKWRVHTNSFIPKSRYLDSSIAEYIQNIPGNAGPQTVGIYLRRLNEIEAEASLRGEVTLGTLSCTHMHAWHLHSDAHVEGKGHLSPSIIVDGQVRYAYDSCAGLPLTGLTVKAGQQVYYVAYFEKRNDLPAMQSAILNDFTVTYWDKPRFVYRVWDSAR